MRTCGAHESVPDAGEPAGDQVRHFAQYAQGYSDKSVYVALLQRP